MGGKLVGLAAELVVMGFCCAAVVTNSLLLKSCDLLDLGGLQQEVGSLGLYFADFPDQQDASCVKIDDQSGVNKDAAFNCARVCAVMAFCFGAILLVFGVFRQYIIPLPCTQLLMDVSGGCVQITLSLVYVIWLTDACNTFYCTFGQGGTYLILTQCFWLGASCFTRCMRPGRHERRDEIAANKEAKAAAKEKEKQDREATAASTPSNDNA